ncbi:hypothetical protein DV737_g2248, partial [Chaetothyriales sp. CBS 132003]
MEDKKSWSPQMSTLSGPSADEGQHFAVNRSFKSRVVDSFRRDPAASVTRHTSISSEHHKGFDAEAAARAAASSPLLRRLKGRHLQMMAIGGSIGTGLFVGSGKALAAGGPASLFISFTLIGIMMYCTVQALGELAVTFPVAGSFSHYSTRFIDPAWGFAMGWNYAMQWLITFPLEIISASITINYWIQSVPMNAAWVSLFLALIISINFFGVKGYGEAEFVFSIVKVTAVIGYIILGVLINIAGGPSGSYIGFKLWHNPGAFHNGFKGLCSVFVTAAFAFGGTELIGLAAAETENPRKTLPTAMKQVFWRITIFYVVSLLLVGTLVSYTDPRLLNGKSSADAKASPFVISIQDANIQALPGVMNVVIMISVLSVGNSAIYGSSRTLAALAEQSQAPRILAYIDRKGRPLVAIILASAIGLLAYLAASTRQQEAFDWMLAFSGLSSILTWGSICLAHLRFRHAWAVQGHGLDELAFRSPVGVVGSWVGLIFNVLVLVAQLWTGIWPVGWQEMTGDEIAINFFQTYLTLPVVIFMYLAYKIWYRPKIVKPRDLDLFTDMKLSGLQKEVLKLYRQCLREAGKKPSHSRQHFRDAARREFTRYRNVDRKDFSAIETLLRMGHRKLELYSKVAPLFSLLNDAFAEVQRASRQTRKEWRPRFDVKETAEAYHVDAELPGVEPKDVSVEFVDEHTLSIKGRSERHTEKGTRPDLAIEDAPAQERAASPVSDTSSVKSHQATVEDEEPTNAPASSDGAAEATQPAETERVQKPAKAEESQKELYWFSERHIGSFQRQFAFPARIDQEHIKASLKNGLLSITVPKAAAPESKRISIE